MRLKTLVRMLLAFMLAALTFISPVAQGVTYAKEGEKGQVTADGVKLRSAPDTDSDALAELNCGQEVEVLGEDGNWYKVMYLGTTVGYIRKDYLFVNSTGSRGAYVKTDGTPLMGGPADNSYVVMTLSAGQGLKVKALLGEWYYAVVDTYAGYIHRTDLTISTSPVAGAGMLKQGMQGEEVRKLQQALYNRGFLTKNSDITGIFDTTTRDAVKEYQQALGLSADGVAGTVTLDSIYDSANKVEKANADFYKLKGTVVLLDWFKGGDEWLAKGARFTVTDVRTGKSFRARRFGGWYHADSEPCTAYDAKIMKSLEGYSWNRRPIWVTYNGKTVAASMHTMPHMADPTPGDGFNGHFCIHLLNSLVHETNAECPRHQACVYEAYKAGRAD
ncbi:MAG TPA: SH3 domain-containing protein [Clostridia bacterium]|nr:SH3 domain-containing protein [Clostridia bacterium]